jgi:phosphate transport system permease protein
MASSSRAVRERCIHGVLWIAAATTIAAVLLILIFLGKAGLPALWEVSWDGLLGTRWHPVSFGTPRFGLLPLFGGTLLVTVLATLLAIPFGIGGAAYLAEFASRREREVVKPIVEVLAGIPSVVLGFFALVTIGPWVKWCFGLPSGLTALTGAIVLALMAVPTILSIAEDALRAVPRSYKDASLAVGASHWTTTWRVTLPAAAPGVIAAVMLGVGRVVGETMAVMMVTGNAALLTASPFESVRTMTATIAAEMGEVPHGSTHYRMLFLIGLVLLAITLGVNQIARRFARRARRHGGSL